MTRGLPPSFQFSVADELAQLRDRGERERRQ
jgi:hypothetical protein